MAFLDLALFYMGSKLVDAVVGDLVDRTYKSVLSKVREWRDSRLSQYDEFIPVVRLKFNFDDVLVNLAVTPDSDEALALDIVSQILAQRREKPLAGEHEAFNFYRGSPVAL